MLYILPLLIILSGCATCQYKSPKDYYNDRLREDNINWGPDSRNNILDSQDGSTYYSRDVQIFGATY